MEVASNNGPMLPTRQPTVTRFTPENSDSFQERLNVLFQVFDYKFSRVSCFRFFSFFFRSEPSEQFTNTTKSIFKCVFDIENWFV